MKWSLCLFLLILSVASCQSQTEHESTARVGGACEGCEALFEFGDRTLSSSDTLPKFLETEPKIKITGSVFLKDGKTPARDVILYIYHTNREGIYETTGKETGWDKRHGFIRGWVKTGSDGKYSFYTFRPASYPNRREPEHIHITVKEPELNEYYIDPIVFADDPLLTKQEINRHHNRGGSGMVFPKMRDGILLLERDIVLGLNIPDYN